jgi:hypothetical protein
VPRTTRHWSRWLPAPSATEISEVILLRALQHFPF